MFDTADDKKTLAELFDGRSQLLERTPKAQPDEPRSWRKDEYPS